MFMNNQEGNKMNDAMQSESISELAEAISKAQGEIDGASKIANNPFHNSKYADLHEVITCAKEPLSKNGLSIVQPIQVIDGQMSLTTIVMHKSGQWIKGVMPILLPEKITTGKDGTKSEVKNDPQSIGKLITYYRRYCYCSMIGISQMDDDAESVTIREKTKKQAELPEPEVIEVAPKEYTMIDLENKILSQKRVIPDKLKLREFIKAKADAVSKTPAQIIASAMKSEAQFEGFYNAFNTSLSHTASHPSFSMAGAGSLPQEPAGS